MSSYPHSLLQTSICRLDTRSVDSGIGEVDDNFDDDTDDFGETTDEVTESQDIRFCSILQTLVA